LAQVVEVDAAPVALPMMARAPGVRQMAAANRFAGQVEERAMVVGGFLDVAASATKLKKSTDEKDQPAARVRSYFPEALYINPEIITDRNGNASISIPMADSITTWRMAMLASTTRGALGSATSSIKVFQDFFADLDLPVTLTQGDRVSIPVAVYNYS